MMKIIDRENAQFFELPGCVLIVLCKYEIDNSDTDYLIYNYLLSINSGKFEIRIGAKRLKNHQEPSFRKALINAIYGELLDGIVLDIDEIRKDYFKQKELYDE